MPTGYWGSYRPSIPIALEESMSTTVMGCAAVSMDGYIADDADGIGPMFEWLSSGDVRWTWPGTSDELRSTQASADFAQAQYPDTAVVIMGRRLFDQTNGWNGVPASGEHVIVVTHRPADDWQHYGTAPFTFVGDVETAIKEARERAGDRIVDVAAGQIGSQALRLGLIDQVVMNVVPVVLGSGRPFFAGGAFDPPLELANPSRVVRGDRVTHVAYDVRRN